METKSDFKRFYAETLKECISLIEEESKHEHEQIRVALEVGRKIDQLMSEAAEDDETILKNFARDVSRARGKMISSSKLCEYRQLYLNLGSMETVNAITDRALNDVSMSALFKLSDDEKNTSSRNGVPSANMVSILEKILRLLTRAETQLEDKEINEADWTAVMNNMELIHSKANSIYQKIQGYSGPRQMDFFRPMKTTEPLEMGYQN